MRRIIDIFRFIFISPELLVTILLLASACYFPVIFEEIGRFLKSNNELARFFILIPGVLLAFSVRYIWKILFPQESSDSVLQDWPGYSKLKDRAIASGVICLLAAMTAILGLVLVHRVGIYASGAMVVVSIAVSFIVIINMILAAIKVKEILTHQ